MKLACYHVMSILTYCKQMQDNCMGYMWHMITPWVCQQLSGPQLLQQLLLHQNTALPSSSWALPLQQTDTRAAQKLSKQHIYQSRR